MYPQQSVTVNFYAPIMKLFTLSELPFDTKVKLFILIYSIVTKGIIDLSAALATG